jgi:hypothetical protein
MKNNDKIRERVSYKRFEKIYNTLEGNNKAQTMKTIYNVMEDMKAFHYRTTALHAYESLQLLLEDKNK